MRTSKAPRWRVKHQSRKPTSFGLVDTVDGKDESAAVAAVRALNREPRVIVSVERLD